MSERRKRRSKHRRLKKIKRWLSRIVFFSSNIKNYSTKKRKRRRSKNRPKKNLLDRLKNIYLLYFKPRYKRRRKRPLHKRIVLHLNRFTQNNILSIQKLFSSKKRRKRRKKKQYAVYLMSNQQKTD